MNSSSMQIIEELEGFLSRLKSNQEAMTDVEYYGSMRRLAKLKRQQYGVQTERIDLNVIRAIYKNEGIRIDVWPKNRLKKLRAAYFCDSDDPSVLIADLPREPKLFSLVHELKHHYVDQDRIRIWCLDVTDKSPRIEIGAEVFAAEFIFPVAEFRQYLQRMSIKSNMCTAEDVCRLKHNCVVPVSYQFIVKRLYFLRIVPRGSFDKIKFTKIHDRLYGEPIYKRFQRRQHSPIRS